MTKAEVLAADLDAIVERNVDDFELLRGAQLFVTGGTGFVGPGFSNRSPGQTAASQLQPLLLNA